jgi:hypothetical protein
VLQFRSPEALVDPSAQASEVTKPVLLGVAKAVIEAYPDAAAAQIVVNALAGASSGRSGGRLEFGGVSARSDLLPGVDDGAAATPAVVAPTTPVVPPVPSGAPPIASDVGEVAPVPADAGAAEVGMPEESVTPLEVAPRGESFGAQPASTSESLGGRGHAAIALGVGLALLLLLALADRLRSA